MAHRELPYLIAALALLPFMVTGDSIWMDEGNTAIFALQPDFHQWATMLNLDQGADCQMLLGNFCAWLGGMTFGASEWRLRAINIIWGVLTLVFMARIGRRLGLPWLPLFFAIQPFFWFYTNEARPYAPQITFGAMVLLSLIQFLQDRGQGILWAVTFTVGSIMLCVATMLAPAQIAVTAAVAIFFAAKNGWKIERRALVIMLTGAVLLLPLGYYYLQTLIRGAKGVVVWNIDFRYLVYIPYEISGSLGLGPSIDHLRELALKGVWQSMGQLARECAPAFILLAVVGIVFAYAIPKWRENKYLLPVLLPFLAQVAILFVMGILLHKAFWPRHYSATFPFYVTALAIAVAQLLSSRKKSQLALSLLLLGLLLAASFGIRFGSEHQKEDYRWASAQALSVIQQGKDVWWCGGGNAGIYYGIHFDTRQPGQGAIFILTNRHWDGKFPLQLSGLDAHPPEKIFISRPDVHDSNGNVRKLIHDDNYHLETSRGTFEVWTR